MLKKDDEHWLTILAGKDMPEASPNTAQEARVLREALRAEDRLQQLTARLGAEGYIKSPQAPKIRERLKTAITRIWDSIIPNSFNCQTTFIPSSFNWQTTYLITVHAALIMTVTIATYEWITIKTLSAKQAPIPKSPPESTSAPPLSTFGIIYGTVPVFKFSYNDLQEVEGLKQDFIDAGAEIRERIRLIEITIPKNFSGKLRELCDIYGIELEMVKLSNQFIILPEPQN